MKALSSAVIFSLLLLASGCKENKITTVDLGTVSSNWIYENKTLNFKMPLPQDWFLSRRDAKYPDCWTGEPECLKGQVSKEAKLENFQKTFFGKALHLFSVVDTDKDNLQNMRVKVDVHVVESDIADEKEFIKDLNEKAAGRFSTKPQELAFDSIRIGNQNFVMTKLSVDNNGKPMTIAPAIKSYNNLKLIVAISYSDEKDYRKFLEWLPK